MNGKVTCFIPFGTKEETEITVSELRKSALVATIYIIGGNVKLETEGVKVLDTESLSYGKQFMQLLRKQNLNMFLFIPKPVH